MQVRRSTGGSHGRNAVQAEAFARTATVEAAGRHGRQRTRA